MNNKPHNYSELFSLFAHDKPDKTGTILEKIGSIGFVSSAIAGFFGSVLNDDGTGNSVLLNIAFVLFGIGFFIGLFMFIAAGIHYSGREKGKTNFLASSAYALKNTFLYILLPAFIITALIILWAVITKQPAFQ